MKTKIEVRNNDYVEWFNISREDVDIKKIAGEVCFGYDWENPDTLKSELTILNRFHRK